MCFWGRGEIMSLSFQTDKEVLEQIVQRLTLKRKKLGMSQKELAARAGISFRTIQSIEAGGNCTILSLLAVIRSLGESLSLAGLLGIGSEDESYLSPREIHEKNKGRK